MRGALCVFDGPTSSEEGGRGGGEGGGEGRWVARARGTGAFLKVYKLHSVHGL